MSHGLTSTDFMYTTEHAAWHAFETGMPTLEVGDAIATWKLARKTAKLEWDPIVVPSFFLKRVELVTAEDVVLVPTVVKDGVLYSVVEDLTGRKVLRNDTDVVLGSGVGDGYVAVTNKDLGEFAEVLADQGALFWTAGSLYGGAKVFITMRLGEPYVIGLDDRMVTVPFLTFTNSNDGAGSLYVQPSTFEVVCANTAKASEIAGERMGRQFTFRHTTNVKERIEDAKKAIAGSAQELTEIRQMEQDLYDLKITPAEVELFLDQFEPTKPVDEVGASKRVRTNQDKARNDWYDAYFSPVKISDDQRYTALGLFRASTDWVDHAQRSRGEYGRAYRSLLAINPQKAQAARLARQVATQS